MFATMPISAINYVCIFGIRTKNKNFSQSIIYRLNPKCQNDASQTFTSILNAIRDSLPHEFRAENPQKTVHPQFLQDSYYSRKYEKWDLEAAKHFYQRLEKNNLLNKNSNIIDSCFCGIEMIQVCMQTVLI